MRGNASSPDRYSQRCAVSTRDGGMRSAGFPPYGASRGTVTAVWRTEGVILMGAFGPRFHHPPSNVRDAVPDLFGVGVMCQTLQSSAISLSYRTPSRRNVCGFTLPATGFTCHTQFSKAASFTTHVSCCRSQFRSTSILHSVLRSASFPVRNISPSPPVERSAEKTSSGTRCCPNCSSPAW